MGISSPRGDEDCTGKNKATDPRFRNQALMGFFALGLCIGLVVAERVYVRRQLDNPGGQRSQQLRLESGLQQQRRQGGSGGGGSSGSSSKAGAISKLDLDYTGPARNDLEAVLRKVAPTKEVLVAVANKNVNWNGMLDTFTQGIVRAKVGLGGGGGGLVVC